MRTWAFSMLVCLAAGCVPDLHVKASRVQQTRVVAVRATPAEATPGQKVTWQAIVVTPLTPPAAMQIDWSMCEAPRNPADSITVTGACFGEDDQLAADGGAPTVREIGGHGATAEGSIPSDACRKIGPEVSAMAAPGASAQRPPDADITGGYQLPLRLKLGDPTPGGDPRIDISFDRQRVRCNLANAPADDARAYTMRYKANQNPELSGVEVAGNILAVNDGMTYQVPKGSKLTLRIGWDPSSRETYVLFDPVQRAVVERSETLDVSWYTNGGEFEHDRTTQDGTDPISSNALVLDPTVAQVIKVWVILRDDRGGVGVATLSLLPT